MIGLKFKATTCGASCVATFGKCAAPCKWRCCVGPYQATNALWLTHMSPRMSPGAILAAARRWRRQPMRGGRPGPDVATGRARELPARGGRRHASHHGVLSTQDDRARWLSDAAPRVQPVPLALEYPPCPYTGVFRFRLTPRVRQKVQFATRRPGKPLGTFPSDWATST